MAYIPYLYNVPWSNVIQTLEKLIDKTEIQSINDIVCPKVLLYTIQMNPFSD